MISLAAAEALAISDGDRVERYAWGWKAASTSFGLVRMAVLFWTICVIHPSVR